MSHLRLVHPARPLLKREQLRHFATPKTWAEIVELEPRMHRFQWTDGIVDADEYGFGFLMWLRSARSWVLTLRGRRHVGLT